MQATWRAQDLGVVAGRRSTPETGATLTCRRRDVSIEADWRLKVQ
ncbi:hypothetical protein [Sinomonas sp. G460-2]